MRGGGIDLNWQDASKSVPDTSRIVLVYAAIKYPHWQFGAYSDGEWRSVSGRVKIEATHWCELTAPKEGGE